MAELQTRLEQDLQKKDEVSAQLAQIEQSLNALRKSIRDNERLRLTLEANQTKLRAELVELESSAQELMADLALLLLRGYPVKQNSTLALLLNQENPQRAARLLAYHQLLTQSSMTTLDRLSEKIATINETEKRLAKQSSALETLIAEQETDVREASALVARRQDVLAQIEREIDQSTSTLERLRQDEARLSEILALAQKRPLDELTDDEPPNVLAMKGQLPMPVQGAIQQRFGQRRKGGHAWRGWVIETDAQAPVHAIAAGRVVYANWLRGYGLLIIIDHQDQVLSLYAHNDTLFFEVGDWVRQGQHIASAGQPRYEAESPFYGLYFELRENGKPTDPAAWL
ncbi:MAG TPA: peptidoglycan DD-metalloendopeptidase family protein, partial [Wenzhouxiangella sp.]